PTGVKQVGHLARTGRRVAMQGLVLGFTHGLVNGVPLAVKPGAILFSQAANYLVHAQGVSRRAVYLPQRRGHKAFSCRTTETGIHFQFDQSERPVNTPFLERPGIGEAQIIETLHGLAVRSGLESHAADLRPYLNGDIEPVVTFPTAAEAKGRGRPLVAL